MSKKPLLQVIRHRDLDGIAVLMVIESESMTKKKGEHDTEFVKRIVSAYFNAVGALGVNPIR